MLYSFFKKCSGYSRKLQIFILLLSFCLLSAGCKSDPASEPLSPVSRSAFYLNTVITITLYDNSSPDLITDCFSLCAEYEKQFSRTDPDSALYRLNRQTGSKRDLSPQLLELISLGLYYYDLSGGLFDITVAPLSELWAFSSESPSLPDDGTIKRALEHVDGSGLSVSDHSLFLSDSAATLDLGGIAKGYIADRLKEYLVSNGVTSALIDLGGNILCVGEKPDGTGFHIGIREPFSSQGTSIAIVSVRDLSVVTSGVYERCFTEDGVFYHHLLDPRTGYPFDSDLYSVSILSPSSTDGDALSTTCFALGAEQGMELINSLPDTYAIFVTKENKLLFSDGAEQFLYQ